MIKFKKDKRILIQKCRNDFFNKYLFLDYDIRDFKGFVEHIKQVKTKKQLNQIINNLFS